ncbi:DUF2398 family protein [Nocardia blacklockiae]|uniref:DUF2398 family protein n=1 Tax=Nocardia blacklockiae TaxID=480036 RepID=UPI0018941D3F|nr:DUF2398 family protein [Nocardia blacklockiae]MBF6170690.1 DUF2398 family protein [Nocardia blacklockiae]
MSRDLAERQRAFTGLLAHPVLDRRRHPELFALVRARHHRGVLIEWFASRLGYRLVVTESAARLFRLPLGDVVVAPPGYDRPHRRVLVLAILAAAAAEDADDITTIQDLSDRARALAAHPDAGLAPYEPDQFGDRRLFAQAVELLVAAGALRPIDRDAGDLRDGWAHRRNAVGGAYAVDRELLLRMVDPAALTAALSERHIGADVSSTAESAARFGVMRRLVELPACLYADLTEAEQNYAVGQRTRIVAWCAEMTGWTVEQRAEGLALIAAEEADTDLPFPRLRAVDFATLMMLEELQRHGDEQGYVAEAEFDRAAAEVRARYPKAMTKELHSDRAVRERGEELLRALDLVRPSERHGWWRLSPVAARFRNPRVVSVTERLDAGTTEDGDDGRDDH